MLCHFFKLVTFLFTPPPLVLVKYTLSCYSKLIKTFYLLPFQGWNNYVPLVRALLENGADYNQLVTEDAIKDGKTPLQLACK